MVHSSKVYSFTITKTVMMLPACVVLLGILEFPSNVFSLPGSYDFCGHGKKIALTFDDGPFRSESRTRAVLEELSASNVKATFFIAPNSVGQAWDPNTCERAREIVAAGHEVQSHSFNHINFANSGNLASELSQVISWLEGCGIHLSAPHLTQFRPPYGGFTSWRRQEANELGYAVSSWNLDTFDWQDPSVESVMGIVNRRKIEHERAGAESVVMLMHDHSHTPGRIAAIKALYSDYEFVTASQCYSNCVWRFCKSPDGYKIWDDGQAQNNPPEPQPTPSPTPSPTHSPTPALTPAPTIAAPTFASPTAITTPKPATLSPPSPTPAPATGSRPQTNKPTQTESPLQQEQPSSDELSASPQIATLVHVLFGMITFVLAAIL